MAPPTHLFSLVKVLQASGEASAFHRKSPQSRDPSLASRRQVTHSSGGLLPETFCYGFSDPSNAEDSAWKEPSVPIFPPLGKTVMPGAEGCRAAQYIVV